jgi:uncharacterized membrane protein
VTPLARPLALAGLITLATIAIAIWGYVQLPAGVTFPMNYGIDGRPHSFLPKPEGLAVMPAVSALVVTILAWVSARSRRVAASAEAYGLLVTGLAALFLVAQGALIAQAIDPAFDVLRWVFLAAAVFLVLLGNTLGKVRQNSVFGVRTKATLGDARIWDKTHRFTGRWMVLAALALAALALLAPDHRLLIAGLVLAAAGPPLAGILYARRLAAASPA